MSRSIFDDTIMPSGSDQLAQQYKQYYDSRIAAAKNPNPVGVLASLRRQATKMDPRYRSVHRPPIGGPRVGPQNTTKQDLIDFLNEREPAPAVYERPPVQQYQVDPNQVLNEFIGGPGAGFGLEFGGQRTQTNQLRSIEARAQSAIEARRLAKQEAARLGEKFILQNKADIDPYGQGLAGEQFRANQRILATPLSELAAMMRGGPGNPRRQLANQDVNNYGAAMARMNALRGTGDYDKRQMESNAIASIADLAQRQYEIGMAESGAQPYQDVANILGEVPYHEFARQIAVAQDGMDPGLAAGLFGPEMDLEYERNALNSRLIQQGMPPHTMDQFIYEFMGEDAYFQYMADKAEKLAFGTPEELEQAEQDALDLANDVIIKNAFGFSPMDIKGVDPAVTREAFQNEAFQGLVDQGLTTMRDENEMAQIGTGKDLGNALANQWLAQGGTPIEAQVLRQIFVTFDFSLG